MFKSATKSIFLLLLTIQFAGIAQSQPSKQKITQAEYIELYKDYAIKEMKRSGVPASITLAQGILESGNGNSPLARKANNHFGIKCHSDWDGPTFHQDDDARDECFRKYKDPIESFKDHSDFLLKKRYAALFELKQTDYKGWAHGLKKAGYATNPKYPKLLIGIIERNNLDQYDRLGGRSKKRKEQIAEHQASFEEASDRKIEKQSTSTFKVKLHPNNIRYVEVEEGMAIEDLADRYNMGDWQIYKYNDIDKSKDYLPGGKVFLQPKRSRAKEDYHTLAEGESLWDVSQQYGIKLKKLYKKNRLEAGAKVSAGTMLYLRKKKPR